MIRRTGNPTARRLTLMYLFGSGLVYVLTFPLWGNVSALRALHMDIPGWATDADFQTKALANLVAGVDMLIGGAGLIARRQWGIPVTIVGLIFQSSIYVAELVLYHYLPTLGVAVVVIPTCMAIGYSLTRR